MSNHEEFRTYDGGYVSVTKAERREPVAHRVGPNPEDVEVDDGYSPPAFGVSHGGVLPVTLIRDEMIRLGVWLIANAADAVDMPVDRVPLPDLGAGLL